MESVDSENAWSVDWRTRWAETRDRSRGWWKRWIAAVETVGIALGIVSHMTTTGWRVLDVGFLVVGWIALSVFVVLGVLTSRQWLIAPARIRIERLDARLSTIEEFLSSETASESGERPGKNSGKTNAQAFADLVQHNLREIADYRARAQNEDSKDLRTEYLAFRKDSLGTLGIYKPKIVGASFGGMDAQACRDLVAMKTPTEGFLRILDRQEKSLERLALM